MAPKKSVTKKAQQEEEKKIGPKRVSRNSVAKKGKEPAEKKEGQKKPAKKPQPKQQAKLPVKKAAKAMKSVAVKKAAANEIETKMELEPAVVEEVTPAVVETTPAETAPASKPIPDEQHSPDQKLARYKNMVQVMQDESSSSIVDHKTDVAGLELLISEAKEALDKSRAKLRAQEIQDVYEKKCREAKGGSIPVTKRITSSKRMYDLEEARGNCDDVKEGLVLEFMNMEDVSHWTFIMYYGYKRCPNGNRLDMFNEAYSCLEPTSAPGLNIRLDDLGSYTRKRRRCEENEEKEDEKKAAAMKSQADYAVFLEAIREKSGFLADPHSEEEDYFQTCIQNSR